MLHDAREKREFICKISNFFHNRAAVFVENVQQGRCEGKKKTGRQKRLLLSAGWLLARLLTQGGLFDGEIFACCFAVQIDGDGIISCGKKLACVEVHSLRIVTINTFGKESFIPI